MDTEEIEKELRHFEMLSQLLIENIKALKICHELILKKIQKDNIKISYQTETLKINSDASVILDSIMKKSFSPDAINRFTGGLNP